MNTKEIRSRLVEMLAADNNKGAEELVSSATNNLDSEAMVDVALDIENCPATVLDAALECFANTHSSAKRHGSWTHSFSHFSSQLWERKLWIWVKRLNRIAFEGVAEKRDPTCIDRLLLDFIKNASWDMDPEDLGYVKEGLKWFSPEDECERRWLNRMRNSPFESEAAFILFQIGQLQEEEYVELIEWIKGRRERLIELGIKSPEIDNVNWIVLRYGNSK